MSEEDEFRRIEKLPIERVKQELTHELAKRPWGALIERAKHWSAQCGLFGSPEEVANMVAVDMLNTFEECWGLPKTDIPAYGETE